MSVNGKPTIDRIDHGVIPSNDLGRAHRFYGSFMGGEIDHLTNLTIRGLNREVPQIIFYTLANHKGWGVALQDFPISPNPARPLEGVVYGFEVAADNLDGHHGIWCVPGSPYASMDGALNAIRFAREHGRPFLGTCGGFQHALIEYARNVLGLTNADHTESNPAASMPFISRLACSLSGGEGTVHLKPESRAFSIYGARETTERYNCNFGLNSGFRSLLDGSRMRVAGVDDAGEVRIVELDGHPFYIATLFQPELAVLAGVTHPLLKAFVRQAAKSRAVDLPNESKNLSATSVKAGGLKC